MEYIIKEYQTYAERQSVSKHREEHGMTGEYDADRTAQLYKRLIQRAEHYKDYNRQHLLETTGVTRVDFTRNPMDGPSNWQNLEVRFGKDVSYRPEQLEPDAEATESEEVVQNE